MPIDGDTASNEITEFHDVDHTNNEGLLHGLTTLGGQPWAGSREQALWRNQLRTSTQLLIRLDAELTERHGLSIADYSALVVIAEAPAEGIRMSSLAEIVMISRSRLTHCIDRLEARGLVARTKAEDDRRGLICVLRPKGRRLLVDAMPTHVGGVRAFFADHIADDELAVLEAFLAKVLLALRAPGASLPKDGHLTVDDLGPRI